MTSKGNGIICIIFFKFIFINTMYLTEVFLSTYEKHQLFNEIILNYVSKILNYVKFYVSNVLVSHDNS